MWHSRRTYLAAIGATTGAGLGGCASVDIGVFGDGDDYSTELLLNWQLGGLHTPYVVARERGYYAEEGINLENIERGQGSDFSATQVGLENVDFGVTSGDQVLAVTDEGLAPRCVAVVMQRGPVVLFTDRDAFGERLDEPDQLAETTVGSGPGMVRTMTEAYLEYHGLSDDVTVADAGADVVQQLLTGEVDVGAGVFSDVVDARHQGGEIDELSVAADVPAYGHVIATHDELIDTAPALVEGVLRATARGAAWAGTEPAAATDLLVEAEPELEPVRENQRDKWEALANEYMLSEAVETNGWGVSDENVWDATAEVLADHDLVDDALDPQTVWTNEYLDTDDEYVGGFADYVGE